MRYNILFHVNISAVEDLATQLDSRHYQYESVDKWQETCMVYYFPWDHDMALRMAPIFRETIDVPLSLCGLMSFPVPRVLGGCGKVVDVVKG